MDKKIIDFENMITKKINRTLEQIGETKGELKRNINDNRHEIVTFGLAKYAEKITRLNGELVLLYELQDDFKAIFNID